MEDEQKNKIIQNIQKRNGAIMIIWQYGLENKDMNQKFQLMI